MIEWLDDRHFDLQAWVRDALTLLAPIVLLFGGKDVFVLRRRKDRAHSRLHFHLKVGFTGLVFGLEIAQLVFAATHAGSALAIASHAIVLAALLGALPLIRLSHYRSRRSSTTLLMFWLLFLVQRIVALRSAVVHREYEHSVAPFVIRVLLLSAALAAFTAECVGPESSEGVLRLPDEEGEEPLDSPVLKANIFSRLSFSWMTPMMVMGYKSYITEEQLWKLPRDDQADRLSQTFKKNWMHETKTKRYSLWLAILKSYGMPFVVAFFLKLIQDALAFLQPQLLRRLLTFVSSFKTDDPEPPSHGYIIAFLMAISAIVQTAFLHQYFARCFETGMRIRGGLIGALYEKALVLSNAEKGARASGDIVNLQSTDTTRLQDMCSYGLILFGVFQITLAFISLYNLMGVFGLAGVAVMVLSLPLNGGMARVGTKFQKRQMKIKDSRTRLMSEILSCSRIIKLYAWEPYFTERLLSIRNGQELPLLKKIGYLNSLTTCLWTVTPFLVSFTSFAVFSKFSDKPLSSDIVFPALSLFQLLQFPLAILPNVISGWIEAFVSVNRLRDFLSANELQADAVKIIEPRESLKEGDELIKVQNADFSWSEKQSSPTLSNIDLSVKKGALTAIVGRVGCGKSSILSAILGEMSRSDGYVEVRGTVAYVPQNPWISSGTVKDNITFGFPFDQEWYDTVIDACALTPDLAILPDGDDSEVGERGLSLSGGQKARLSLARAVYTRADIYLFDDPLSAVDQHVGRHLFDHVLGANGLLASKARLLCTNAIQYVRDADEVVLVRKGYVTERGAYSSLGEDSEIRKLLREFGHDHSNEVDDEDEKPMNGDARPKEDVKENGHADASAKDLPKVDKARLRRHSTLQRVQPIDDQKRELMKELKRSTSKGNSKEHREQGSVKLDIYRKYIDANGLWASLGYVLTIGAAQAVQVGTNVWLKDWSQANSDAGGNINATYFMGIYLGFGLFNAILTLVNGFFLYSFCVIRSARVMHDGMFLALMRAPLRFFETTASGTILNRFSRDVYVIDEVLARTFGGFFRMSASVIGTAVVISATTPIFLVVIIPLLFVYKRTQSYYLATSRELKRLDATTKSPIFASFSETLAGLVTIRAYRQQRRFIGNNEVRVDRNQEAYYASINCNRWLAVRLELMGAMIIFAAAVLAVFSLTTLERLDAGLVGLMMSYALGTTQALNWLVRSATEVETNIVSVERCQEYRELEPEAAEHTEHPIPEGWPAEGAIRFDHYSTRYREGLDLVLRDVNVDISPREKIGVCGRTGAGKSSMTMALFRVIEPTSGTIWLDNVDISKIGLRDLRKSLCIVPQDSQCFEGNMRDNLDPTGSTSDERMWRALEQTRMKEHVESMEGKLDARVDEGGTNLSQGQRQLLCLARALLRDSKVLVLDEATSAIDVESDRDVQAVIREQFKDVTLFVIAHRLNTIMDADRIISMDKGQVAEMDEPDKLLRKKDSLFASMAAETGSATPSRTPGTSTPRKAD